MITSWTRVRDTDTGAVYSVPAGDELDTHEVLDEPGADRHGRPLPAFADGKDPGMYDPTGENVEQVVAYLEQAADDERVRIIAAETEGKARTTITEWTPQPPTE